MNLAATVALRKPLRPMIPRVWSTGTSEGATKGWDTRGRGREEEVKTYITSYIPVYEKVKGQFKEVMGKFGAVEGRLKAPESIIEKVSNRGIALSDLHDTIGLRVTVKDLATLKEAVDTAKANFSIVDEDNKLNNPTGGIYRAYHLTATMDGKPVEMQIRTENQSKFASWMHDTVYKGAASQSQNALAYAKKWADVIYSLDKGERNVKIPECPAELRSNCFSLNRPYVEHLLGKGYMK